MNQIILALQARERDAWAFHKAVEACGNGKKTRLYWTSLNKWVAFYDALKDAEAIAR